MNQINIYDNLMLQIQKLKKEFNYSKALKHLLSHGVLFGHSSNYHFEIAKLYALMLNENNAIKHLIKATKCNNLNLDVIFDEITLFNHMPNAILKFCRYLLIKNYDNYRIYITCSNIHRVYKQHDIAINFLKNALESYPKTLIIHSKLVELYCNLGEYHLARQQLIKALQLKNSRIIQNENLYFVSPFFLIHGKYKFGLKLLESRFPSSYQDNFRKIYPHYKEKKWDGISPLTNKNILFHYEAGYGDMINFVRYVQRLKKMDCHITISSPPNMKRFFANIHEIDTITPITEITDNFDFEILPLSMPYIFNDSITTIPNDKLNFRNSFVNQALLLGNTQNPKIGFFWRGGESYSLRFIKLKEMLAIFPPTLHLYCFQIEFTKDEEELMNKRGNITILRPKITDWADTAGFLEQMDLLITIDSGIANLASALGMGNKLWVMLPLDADWRWYCTKTNYPPWHPDARTFRQNKFNDWGNVIDDVRTELNKFLEDWVSE